MLTVTVQPLPSVIVHVYEPGHNDVAVGDVCPLFHKYVYGVTPELAITVAVPSHKPLHVTGILLIVVVTPGVFGTVTQTLSKQPFASVTTTQYKPGIRFTAVLVVWPLFQRKE